MHAQVYPLECLQLSYCQENGSIRVLFSRKFPSLVNCCTIDWFSEWPEDALKSVASKFLSGIEMESESTRVAVEDMCMSFHQSVRRLAIDFHRELQRHYYATPTSYLELIHTYKNLLGKKQKDIHDIKCRYVNMYKNRFVD